MFGKGLKEEFTWTRIGYVWHREARFGYYGGGPERYEYHPGISGSKGDFEFPADRAPVTKVPQQNLPNNGEAPAEAYTYGKTFTLLPVFDSFPISCIS